MIRMVSTSVLLTAGDGPLLPMMMVLMQLMAGAVCIGMGLGSHRGGVVAVGAAVLAAAVGLAVRRQWVFPGNAIVLADADRLMLAPCTDAALDEPYRRLKFIEVSTLDADPALLLCPIDVPDWIGHLPRRKRARAAERYRRYGAPLVLRQSVLTQLCGRDIDLDALCDTLNNNRLYDQLHTLCDEEAFTHPSSLESGARIYHAGSEARLCRVGICVRLPQDGDVWMFPLAEIESAASMADFSADGVRRIILILAFPDGTLFGLIDSDPLFSPLYDRLSNLPGFDQRAFVRAIAQSGTDLLYVYRRPARQCDLPKK